MSKIVIVLASLFPLALVGCGGSANAPLLTSSENTAAAPNTTSTTPTTQTITFSPNSLALGSTVTLQGTASSGLAVTYASQTPSVCSVSGMTVTGLTLGTCVVTANQAGNSSYTAATQVSGIFSVLNAQTISNLPSPTLTANQLVVLSPVSSSGLPVTVASVTPAICLVAQNVLLKAVTTGTCTLLASQAGSSLYAAATSLSVSTTVGPSNTALVPNAVLASWIATPQAGSTTADTSTTLEGLYTNTSGAYGLIDGANNFNYYDFNGLLFGSLTQNANTWVLNASSSYYPASTVTTPVTSTTANGSFVTKQSFTALAQSITTVTTPFLSLTYAVDNGFAASQSSIAGNWLYNDGQNQFNLNISSSGIISGTEVDNVGGACNVMGTIVQSEPSSQHNLYSISLSATDVPGAFCNISTTIPYTGLAALNFAKAGGSDSNGYLPTLLVLAQSGSTISPVKLTFYKP